MTSPQPESELQKLEAVPAEILAWLKHIAESLHIIHAATPNAAPLPLAPTAPVEPPAPILTPVTPAEAVALCLKASEGTGGYRNGLSWNQLAYLRTLEPKALADFLAQVGQQPDCAAAAGAVGDSLGWIVGLNDAGQGILAALKDAIPSTILDSMTDPRS